MPSQPAFTITSAMPADASKMSEVKAAAVRTLCREHYTDAQIASWTRPKDAEALRSQVASDPAFVARSGPDIVGYSQLRPSSGEVLAVYVAPTHGGRGIGAALLRAVERCAAAERLESVWVDASLNARTFYEAGGYVARESMSFPLDDGVELPCVRMSKALVRDPTSQPHQR